jgi:transcriptional regulator with XRE-family HTH domain
MKNHNPMSIALRVKQIREEQKLTKNKMAASLGMDSSQYGKVEAGTLSLSLDKFMDFCSIYNINPEWLHSERGEKYKSDVKPAVYNHVDNEPKVSFLPRVITVYEDERDAISIVATKAAAGYLNGYADPEFIERLPVINAPGYKGGLHRAFEIRGNSMPPLHSGAIVIGQYVEHITGIRDRRVHIIVTKSEGIVLKRVINSPEEEKLILISDNPNKREYPNYTVDYSEILEIWYWRGGLIRELPDPSDLYSRMNDMEAKITVLDEFYRQLKKGTFTLQPVKR